MCQAIVDSRTAAESAKHYEVTRCTIQKLISLSHRSSLLAIETRGKGGRREHLTEEP
jgi:hypothetical protein